MPTLWSQTLIPTSRQVPAEAEVPSHQLMLRAGYIHKLGAGVYDYLPLGLRSLRKVMAIIRQEMDRAGGAEVLLPTLQPVELWEKTGRKATYGENLFVVKDRHGREIALGPTHEEVVTELVATHVKSYKQLPLTLYQIQTKFRDEFRPRFGILRSREFQMKDAYSFHLKLEGPGGLDETYQKQFDAYCKIFKRCGLPYEVVEAESGPIGGSASYEFMVPSPTGEDVILKSDKGNYAANVEKCEIGPRKVSETFAPYLASGESPGAMCVADLPAAEPTGELEKVHTPGCASIEDVAAFFKKQLKTKLKTANMLKTLVYQSEFGHDTHPDLVRSQLRQSGRVGGQSWNRGLFIAVVRGDHKVNTAKLRSIVSPIYPDMLEMSLVDPVQADEWGFKIGYVGPQVIQEDGLNDVFIIVDPDAMQGGFWVTGANEADHHVKHFNWKRDVLDPLGDAAKEQVIVADIRNATDGDPSPKNDGGVLQATKGIEIGHVFKLGCKYSESLGAMVMDENNERKPLVMGCYGIGVNRILAGAIERESGHDENGIILPAAIAPYAVLITPIKYEGQVKETVGRLAVELESAGLDVLIDDRDERPGVKFKDGDLIGIPVRITVGDKALADGQVEVKPRTAKEAELVVVDQASKRVAELVSEL